MKKDLKNILLSAITIFELSSSPVFAQNANPVGMRYVGSQQYAGQNTTIVNPNTQTKYVAPQINSIYAQQMNRVSEIPLYGKNKSVYFYGQQKKDEGPFAGSGLYMFAAFSTGKTENGINLEHGEISNGEADANDDMGTATGLTLGVGRVMSNSLSVEFMYSNYSKMKYGDWVKFNSTTEEPVLDENGEETEESEEVPFVDDTTYEVVSGGGITSRFIGLGFKYNLENLFGSIAGRLKPYFGFQLGIAENSIDDFTVNDEEGYYDGDSIPDLNSEDEEDPIGDLSTDGTSYFEESYYNGEINFIGDTTRSFAIGAEVGFSVELEGNLSIDIFYKMNNFGKVKTSGNSLSIYDIDTTEFYISSEDSECADGFTIASSDDTNIVCVADAITDEGIQSLTQRRVQSGDMSFRQYGIKLKYMF